MRIGAAAGRPSAARGTRAGGDRGERPGALLDLAQVDPLLDRVGALAARTEDDGRDPGGAQDRGVHPRGVADDLDLPRRRPPPPAARTARDDLGVRGDLERLAHERHARARVEGRLARRATVEHVLELGLDPGGCLARQRAPLDLERAALG